jgi:hypothetical protein
MHSFSRKWTIPGTCPTPALWIFSLQHLSAKMLAEMGPGCVLGFVLVSAESSIVQHHQHQSSTNPQFQLSLMYEGKDSTFLLKQTTLVLAKNKCSGSLEGSAEQGCSSSESHTSPPLELYMYNNPFLSMHCPSLHLYANFTHIKCSRLITSNYPTTQLGMGKENIPKRKSRCLSQKGHGCQGSWLSQPPFPPLFQSTVPRHPKQFSAPGLCHLLPSTMYLLGLSLDSTSRSLLWPSIRIM